MAELAARVIASPSSAWARYERAARASGAIGAIALLSIGVVMGAASFAAPAGLASHAFELLAGAVMLLAGLLLLRMVALHRLCGPVRIGFAPGELALDGAFLYLGTALPAYAAGHVPYAVALIQLAAALAGLAAGASAMMLSRLTMPTARSSPLSLTNTLREGLILITGTVLLAIGVSELPGSVLTIPKWSWISFLGITAPGMVLLLLREGIEQRMRVWRSSGPGRRALGIFGVEILLIAGLAVLLYGSYANLTLGINGFRMSIAGSRSGLMLWAGAALLLILRGALKLALNRPGRSRPHRVLLASLYVAALLPFIYGERAVITGRSPALLVGHAAPAALVILGAALLILIPGRVTPQAI